MTRRILAVLLSVVLAAVGTAAVMLYVRSADARATAGKKVKLVLVADRQIGPGTSGKALRTGGYLRQVRMPAETLPDDALAQITGDLDGLVTTSAVQKGQLLLRAMFGTAVKNGTGLVIPDGQIAITARVKANVFGAGYVRPGTKVAIFYTYTPTDDAHRNVVSGAGLERGHAINSVTRLLMTNVEVIAVGPVPGQKNIGTGDTGSNPGLTGGSTGTGANDEVAVTFAVSQVDAERLAHAVALGGELNAGMVGDSSDVQPDTGVDNRSLFG
jgi:pilus assembly protein CpaB